MRLSFKHTGIVRQSESLSYDCTWISRPSTSSPDFFFAACQPVRELMRRIRIAKVTYEPSAWEPRFSFRGCFCRFWAVPPLQLARIRRAASKDFLPACSRTRRPFARLRPWLPPCACADTPRAASRYRCGGRASSMPPAASRAPVLLSARVSLIRLGSSMPPPYFPRTFPCSGALFPPQGPSGWFPCFVGTYRALRLPAALPALLRCLRCAVPPLRLGLRSRG